MEKHIFTQIRLSIYTISILLIFSCNTKDQTIYPPLSGLAKLDSVQKDEINYPVAHQHLELAERAVIRPIYIETEKGKHAQHNGYQIGIKLRNLATATSYKHVKIKITYYGKNREPLNSEEITIKKQSNHSIASLFHLKSLAIRKQAIM